jgi:hypothetical protein
VAKPFSSVNQFITEDDRVLFGQYNGDVWEYVLLVNPGYITWCVTNMDTPPLFSRDLIVKALRASAKTRKEVAEAYKPKPHSIAFLDEWDDDIPF